MKTNQIYFALKDTQHMKSNQISFALPVSNIIIFLGKDNSWLVYNNRPRPSIAIQSRRNNCEAIQIQLPDKSSHKI